MEGQVLLAVTKASANGASVVVPNENVDSSSICYNKANSHFQYEPSHNHNYHPELEQLSRTMPAVPMMNITSENGHNEISCTPTSSSQVRSQSRMSISHDKGLLNMPGQNNCFLNSAVQVLWHLDIFRRSFRELHGHACMGDSCIFCALKELFNQFQSSTESALPPDSLRFALAQAFNDQRRFRLGYMDDAAECFENILFRIHYHITNQEITTAANSGSAASQCLPHCIPHQKFSMNLFEQIVCHSCGATSEPFIFSQMVHYTSTSALCTAQQQQQQSQTTTNETSNVGVTDDINASANKTKFGDLLKLASSMGDIRNCPKMCGARMNIKKVLLNRPDIISIGLVWDTDHPNLSFIRNVYQLIETNIHLNEIFELNDDGSMDKQLDLVGLVTYYGKHYSTYIFNTKLSQWIYFDDATVRVVGRRWQQVVDKCIKGHFQPLLLLYSNPKASIINTKYAFRDIVPMTIIKKQHEPTLDICSDVNTNNNHNSAMINSTNNMLNAQHHCQLPYVQTEVDNNEQCLEYRFNNNNNNNNHHHHHHHQHKQFSDVPDSPSATSTTSYFSDVGDSTDGYISRKTVENIIKIQHRSSSKRQSDSVRNKPNHMLNNYNHKYNRNSSSSLESFDSVIRQSNNNQLNISKLNARKMDHTVNNLTTICSLQRRDSGNSSSDRASSASSTETPHYYPQRINCSKTTQNLHQKTKNISDQGYDSFSLSSSDSYPSTATSPSKLNSKLKQIPEDVQLIDNNAPMDECDKLSSEADILLIKSHEKEREGDLRAAAALSDSAAAKARLAMDIPYSNHQTLISVKMKHSMCVMRSASLHKRVLELEAEEKRMLKAAMEAASHHSRQSSRDSTHSRHSRQGSRDNKDTRSSRELLANKPFDCKTANKDSSAKFAWSMNLEVYATLPKKAKKHNKEPNPQLDHKNDQANEQKIYENLSRVQQSTKLKNSKNLISESEFSDYYSEWEAIKKKRPQNKTMVETNANGWQSCRENDSEVYAEFGSLQKFTSTTSKKQHKVKRKLMFGNFLKTKNRSLPDLREEVMKNKEQPVDNDGKQKLLDEANNRSSVANINAKGFYQSHKSFVAEQGLKTKPALIKVKPPLLARENGSSILSSNNNDNQKVATFKSVQENQPETFDHPKVNAITPKNSFLEELNRKRREILKYNCSDEENSNQAKAQVQGRKGNEISPHPPEIQNQNQMSFPSKIGPVNNSVPFHGANKKPHLFEIANFISKNAQLSQTVCSSNNMNNMAQAVHHQIKSNLHIPIPVNPIVSPSASNIDANNPVASYGKLMSLRQASHYQKPPDYETTLKRIEMMTMNYNNHQNHHEKRSSPFLSLPVGSSINTSTSGPIYSNMKLLNSHVEPNKNVQQSIKTVSISTSFIMEQNQMKTTPTKIAMINNNSIQTYQQQNSLPPKPPQRINSIQTKKSVKFSDQIELVACAEDDQDEPLPNLLLEKVLGQQKNLLYTLQQ